MFNVSKIGDTIGVVLTITGSKGSCSIEFNAKKGSQTHAVIDLIKKSYDHDNNVEILTSDELVAAVLKVYEVCGSTLKTVNAANVARLQMRCLMNDGRAPRRPLNFTMNARGRKKGSKTVKVEKAANDASATNDVSTENVETNDDNVTIGDTIEIVESVETAVEAGDTADTTVQDEGAEIIDVVPETVEEASPVTVKKNSKVTRNRSKKAKVEESAAA